MTAMRRLDDVCDIVMGQAPSGDAYNKDGVGWPLVAGAGDFDGDKLNPKKYTIEATKLCQPGDVILGIRASIGSKIVATGTYCLGRGVAALRPRENLDPRFLWNWLDFVEPELVSKGRGATFKQVNRQDIGELILNLPPLAEQRRIANALDLADGLRRSRREALRRVDELAQSTFLDMFGDPRTNPMGWQVRNLGEISSVKGGLQISGSRSSAPIEVPYLRVANVFRNRLDLSEIKTMKVSSTELKRTMLHAGDLLVVEGHGNPAEIGRVGLWNGSVHPCVHQNHLIRVRCFTEYVDPIYAVAYLNTSGGSSYLLRSARTTSGLNTISSSNVRATPVMLPDIRRQKEFSTRIAGLDTVATTMKKYAMESDALFRSLQYQAFRGEL